jgi:hypothetical protein
MDAMNHKRAAVVVVVVVVVSGKLSAWCHPDR